MKPKDHPLRIWLLSEALEYWNTGELLRKKLN